MLHKIDAHREWIQRGIRHVVKVALIAATLVFAFPAVRAINSASNAARAPNPSDQKATAASGGQAPLSVTTKLISMSVIVRDKNGQPITGLTKDDFTVFDNKKRRTIDVFSSVTTAVEPARPKSLPPNTYSNDLGARNDSPSNLTIILLDSLNTPSFDRAFPRTQIKKLLETLQPQDRIALYSLGSRLRVLHDFTSDASSLLAALNANADVELIDVDAPPSGPTNEHNMQLVPLAEEDTAVEAEHLAGNRAAATAVALRTIAEHVSYLPGRKSLIWISDDFPLYLELANLQRATDGQRLPFATGNELVARALDSAHIAIYPIDARGLETRGVSDIANMSVDAQNAEMARKAEMETIAHHTGGRAYSDTNGIMGSIRRTIDASRVTYELGFSPGDVDWDGSFHKLQVKVNRHDAQIETRDGYYALADPALTPDIVAQLVAETARSRIEATGIRFTVTVSPSAAAVSVGAASKVGLDVSFTLDPNQFAFEVHDGELQDTVDIGFVFVDAKNRIIQRAALALPFKLDPQTYQELSKAGLPLEREVEIPPNAVELHLIVFDRGNSRVGSVRIPVDRSAAPQKSN